MLFVSKGNSFDFYFRRERKADIKRQHDLSVNNLVGDIEANPKDFYRYTNSQKNNNKKKHKKTDRQGIPSF